MKKTSSGHYYVFNTSESVFDVVGTELIYLMRSRNAASS